MQTLFYIGIGINIIGAILLAVFAIQYSMSSRQAHNMPARLSELKAKWATRRLLAIGLMLAGPIICVLATL